jgi:hypothetical protein
MAHIHCPDCGHEFDPIDVVPLAFAILCVNCNQITRRGPNGHCLACGSHSILCLTAILDRPTEIVDDPDNQADGVKE